MATRNAEQIAQDFLERNSLEPTGAPLTALARAVGLRDVDAPTVKWLIELGQANGNPIS